MSSEKAPETLLEAVRYFGNPDNAMVFMVSMRWPNGIICPHCDGLEHSFLQTRRIWKCKNKTCRKQFSVKLGTIFEDSPIGLDKWLPCLWMLANCKNGISSYEVARALGVTQKTAWFMLHRVRLAMQTETFGKMKGTVEADETFIGGKLSNMHKGRRALGGHSTYLGKVAVQGLLERHGHDKVSSVRARVVPNSGATHIQGGVRENVKRGARLYTDAAAAYKGLDAEYIHEVIDHSETYVRGKVHTNGMENFWSLLKRGLKGTYVSVEPFHLFRYIDEQVRRFNDRHMDDLGRFLEVVRGVVGRRLTYDSLTGPCLWRAEA